MKKVASIIAIISAAVFISACGKNTENPVITGEPTLTPTAMPTQQAVNTPTSTPVPTEKPITTITSIPAPTEQPIATLTPTPVPTLTPEEVTMRTKYAAVLQNIYSNQEFPDGEDRGFFEDEDITTNNFAIYDIDSDGKDELIIEYTTTYMAGQETIIYDYDAATDSVREEFLEFPFLTFYDNGVIKAGWSHNQGLAGESFWPYTLYKYDKEADAYTEVGMVDAWDKSFSEKDYEDNTFPKELDLNGDGILYYIDVDGVEDLVDSDKYDKWLKSYTEGAKVVELPYMNLTEENIQSITK